MKRLAMEELCGLILLLMVFLAAKYGSVQVVSAQAQKKEQPVVVVDVEISVLRHLVTLLLKSLKMVNQEKNVNFNWN